MSVYYYAIFFFRFIFLGERFTKSDRNIIGALILKTPGLNYLGCGLSKAKSEELLQLKNEVERIQGELQIAQTPEETKGLEKELANAKDEFNSYARYWINLSFCAANFFAFMAKCYNVTVYQGETAGRVPLHDFHVIEIGVDRALEYQRRMNETAYVLCGDAMAIVDPSTGLGANTAIGTVNYFENITRGM